MARITKEDLKGNELLITLQNTITNLKDFWQKYRDKLAIGLVIAGVAVLFLVIFILTSIRANNEASREFNIGLITYTNVKLSPAERYGGAKKAFEEILSKHPGVRIRNEVRLYLGNCYYSLGDYDRAIEVFDKCIKEDKSTTGIYALEGIGKSYEGKGDYTSAIQAYENAIKEYPRHFLIPLLLLHIGGCYEQMGKAGEAVSTYKKILDSYPDSIWAGDAKTRINLMGK